MEPIRHVGLYLNEPWQFKRPGLMESVLFGAVAFEVGALAALLVHRLTAFLSGGA